ncbi:hypothetical protein BH10ACT3_BH10ACT3_02610 [soil metagenome]
MIDDARDDAQDDGPTGPCLPGGASSAAVRSDRDLADLDDDLDRDELRNRYYGLLQEIRVILPGVQVLLAFLLTVPFADRFPNLDRAGRVAYGVALGSALLSVFCLLTPAVLHRVGIRRARAGRLLWSIRTTVAGLALLALALLSAFWGVSRLVFGGAVAAAVTIPVIVFVGVVWLVLPNNLAVRTGHDADSSAATAHPGDAP